MKTFDVQIAKCGRDFIDFADRIGHKTWIEYRKECDEG